jgi:hypothetical protein
MLVLSNIRRRLILYNEMLEDEINKNDGNNESNALIGL